MIQKRTTNSNPMMSVLPLRDIVVFPQMVVPLFVGREKSLSALRNVTSSEKANKELLLVAQRDAGIEDQLLLGIFSSPICMILIGLILYSIIRSQYKKTKASAKPSDQKTELSEKARITAAS